MTTAMKLLLSTFVTATSFYGVASISHTPDQANALQQIAGSVPWIKLSEQNQQVAGSVPWIKLS
ncbi:hypothetical protein SAMN04488540_1164, partial [Ferrimonas sediminum]